MHIHEKKHKHIPGKEKQHREEGIFYYIEIRDRAYVTESSVARLLLFGEKREC